MDYLLGTSLWLDLADVLVWYRAIKDRLRLLVGPARRGRIPLTVDEVQQEVAALDGRRLSELGNRKVMALADSLLHTSWHPTTPEVSFGLYWTDDKGRRIVNFTEAGDLRASLFALLNQTIAQVESLVDRATTQT